MPIDGKTKAAMEEAGPSDSALLEYAFRSPIQQRAMLHGDFGKRTLPEIRAALMREAGLSDAWAEWAERVKAKPIDVVPTPPMLERLPPPDIEPVPVRFPAPEFPRRFRGVTLDSFDVNFSGPEHAQQLRAARSAVEAWVKLALAGKPACVALVGSQGNGKSTLLWGAVAALTAANRRCYARSWYKLADELRYGGPTPWLPGVVKEPHELRRLLHDSSAIAIDEARPTAATAFDESELGKLAQHAWDNGQAMLVTTNTNPLSNLMGDAPADRFTIVQLDAPSGRNRE
jgi:hypothetical protein